MSKSFSVYNASLFSLADEFTKNIYYIPNFQREYVWQRDRQVACLDSLLRRQPLGTLYSIEHSGIQRGYQVLGPKKVIPNARHSGKAIIDGQQRLTTVSAIFFGVPKDLSSDFAQIAVWVPLKDSSASAFAPDFAKARAFDIANVWKPSSKMGKALRALERNTVLEIKVDGGALDVYSENQAALALKSISFSTPELPEPRGLLLMGPIFKQKDQDCILDFLKNREEKWIGLENRKKEQDDAIAHAKKAGESSAYAESRLEALNREQCETLPGIGLLEQLTNWTAWLNDCSAPSGPHYTGCVHPVIALTGDGWKDQAVLEFYEDLNSRGLPLKDLERTYATFCEALPKTLAVWTEKYERKSWVLHTLHAAIFGTIHAEHARKKYRGPKMQELRDADEHWSLFLAQIADIRCGDTPFFESLRRREEDKRFATAIALLGALNISVSKEGTVVRKGTANPRILQLVQGFYLALCLTNAGSSNEKELCITEVEQVEIRSSPAKWEAWLNTPNGIKARLKLKLSEATEILSRADFGQECASRYEGPGNYMETLCEGSVLAGGRDKVLHVHHIFPQNGAAKKLGKKLNCGGNLVLLGGKANEEVSGSSPANYWIKHILKNHTITGKLLSELCLPEEWRSEEGFKDWWTTKLGGMTWENITKNTTGTKTKSNVGLKFLDEDRAAQILIEYRAKKLKERAEERVRIAQEALSTL